MALSNNALKNLVAGLADLSAGNEVASAINTAAAVTDQTAWVVAAFIVATNVSTTVDFGALKVGDRVIMIPDTAGNSDLLAAVTTAGTLPEAAVVGNAYIVFRQITFPTATAFKW